MAAKQDRSSPFLWKGASFTVTRSKKEGCIEIDTGGLTPLDAKSLAKFLTEWANQKGELNEG